MTKKKIAIQDTYGERFRHCWGCGSDNESGLHLKSYPSEDGKSCIAEIVQMINTQAEFHKTYLEE